MNETPEYFLKGSIELNKMFNALQRTAAGLRRDFREVENLQQSLPGARDFVKKASERIEASIISDLTLVRPNAGLLTPTISLPGEGRDEFVLALSGAENFVRANPHFAISLALRVLGETKIALVYSPINERLYYGESGTGGYDFTAYSSTRTKVSNIENPFDLTIGYNTGDSVYRVKGATQRYTGCPALDLAWVASGKLDMYISNALDFAEIAAGELLISESGGTLEVGADLIASNGKANKLL